MEEIAIVKNAFEKKLNENWERLKVMKEEYQKENEKLRKQLEEQRNENAHLKFTAIETTKNLESLHKKDQMIEVTIFSISLIFFEEFFFHCKIFFLKGFFFFYFANIFQKEIFQAKIFFDFFLWRDKQKYFPSNFFPQ